jgi:hypothetical protein
MAFTHVLDSFEARFVLKMDSDALVTGYGLFDDALAFMAQNPKVGIFGRHLINADGSVKSYKMHTDLMNHEMSVSRRLLGRLPSWYPVAKQALKAGWNLGENVFGGGCFITWDCIREMQKRGFFDLDLGRWRSRLPEDVYLTMCAVAAGFDRAHFAAPDGPLCMAWRDLPFPAREIYRKGYKLIHSVDKGKNISPEQNDGMTAREYFYRMRRKADHIDEDAIDRGQAWTRV